MTASKSFSAKFITVLTDRNNEVFSADTVKAIKYITASSVAIDKCIDQPFFKEIQKNLLKVSRIADAKQDRDNFVAVKVLLKVSRTLCAIGQGFNSELDAHTRILGYQIAKLLKLTAKSAHVSQCRSIVYDELEEKQVLDYKHCASGKGYTLGTTSTQTSSSRMMFALLGMCDIVKRKKDDTIVLQDNDRARAFVALFA